MAQPDGVLCRLARRGNTGAYDVLYRRYRQPVYAFVYHLLGSSGRTADAEDIAQDAFTKAFAAIARKNPDGSFRHWIFTIARNRTFDHLNGSKRTIALVDVEGGGEPPAPPERPQTADVAENNAELEWLVGAVGELPERQREALVMKELGGLSHAEIATEMGTTVSATKKLINRGRAEVSKAAGEAGYRPRRLGKELACAAPVLPLAAIGAGIVIPAGAAAGGTVAGGTAVATIFAVVAVGGGAAVSSHDRPKPNSDKPGKQSAQPAQPGSIVRPQQLAFTAAPAATPRAAAGDSKKERSKKRRASKRHRAHQHGHHEMNRNGAREDRPERDGGDRPDRRNFESSGKRREGARGSDRKRGETRESRGHGERSDRGQGRRGERRDRREGRTRDSRSRDAESRGSARRGDRD